MAVDFKKQIRSEITFYEFTKEIYNFWKQKGASELNGVDLKATDAFCNGTKERLKKENEFKKIYIALNKIYAKNNTQLEAEALNKEKQKLEDSFKRQGKTFKHIVNKLKRKGQWNNNTKMMDPDIYEDVEEYTDEFNPS